VPISMEPTIVRNASIRLSYGDRDVIGLLFGDSKSRSLAYRLFWGMVLVIVVIAKFYPNRAFARLTGTCLMMSGGSVYNYKACYKDDVNDLVARYSEFAKSEQDDEMYAFTLQSDAIRDQLLNRVDYSGMAETR